MPIVREFDSRKLRVRIGNKFQDTCFKANNKKGGRKSFERPPVNRLKAPDFLACCFAFPSRSLVVVVVGSHR